MKNISDKWLRRFVGFAGERDEYQEKMIYKVLGNAGDTAYFSDMRLISEDFDLDIAFLPIGDNFTMGIKDAVKASKLLKAHLNIPIHFNTFPVINQNPKEFVELLENDTGKVMSVGSSFEI